MKFNYTHGNEAKYMVSVYGWNISDYYYCHEYKQAKELFNKLKELVKDASISIYDIKKDIRKEFAKV